MTNNDSDRAVELNDGYRLVIKRPDTTNRKLVQRGHYMRLVTDFTIRSSLNTSNVDDEERSKRVT